MVAIDGPSGSGKSTVARALARRHGWAWVDTGAMYRALTWAVLHEGIPVDDRSRIAGLAQRLPLAVSTDPDAPAIRVGDADVTAAIRSAEVTAAVSAVSAIPEVREELIRRQRAMATAGGVVMEGRDIGSTVLPAATLKVFLTADADERAQRRAGETGEASSDVAAALSRRDQLDSTRATSPLRQAPDALLIDSSGRSVTEVVDRVEGALARRVGESGAQADSGGPAEGAGDMAAETSEAPPLPSTRATTAGAVLLAEGWQLRLVRAAARLLVRAVLRVRLIGVDRLPAGPVLVAGNHTGFLDGPLVYILLPRPAIFLAKAELFGGLWSGPLRLARQLPVHRGTPDRRALHTAVAVLMAGGTVGMFPEGTRGEGKIETIKDGVGYIASRTGCPVVPVVCRGTAAALPRGARLPRFRSRVDIVFGEPFSLPMRDALRRSDIRAAADRIAAALRDLVAEAGLS